MMTDAEIQDQARDVFTADADHRARFNAGLEAVPGQPFVSRSPLTPEKLRQLANAIRAKQGLGPLPPLA